MARNNRRGRLPGQTTQDVRAQIAASETSLTSTADVGNLGPKLNPLPTPGQKVAVPSQAMMGSSEPLHDWGKYGVLLAGFIAVVTVIWQFADTVFAVKSMGEDVKVLQRKSDELVHTSADVAARVSSLERGGTSPKQVSPKLKEPQSTN